MGIDSGRSYETSERAPEGPQRRGPEIHPYLRVRPDLAEQAGWDEPGPEDEAPRRVSADVTTDDWRRDGTGPMDAPEPRIPDGSGTRLLRDPTPDPEDYDDLWGPGA